MSYSVRNADHEKKIVYIIDNCDGRSVTNSAEDVIYNLNIQYPGFRVIYRDTEGCWDELVHDFDGTFVGFKPGALET